MTTTSTYLDEFIDKMYLVPNDINRHLRLIRTLDKKAQTVQQSLTPLQVRFLNQLKQYKQSLNGSMSNGSTKKQISPQMSDLPISLRNEYEKIVTKQKEVYGFYKEKYEVSQQLRIMVSEIYEQLEAELKNKMIEKTEEERRLFESRRKALGKFLAGSAVNGVSGQGTILGAKGSTSTNGIYPNFNQFMYDIKQPTYCYCGRASFGEMVMCENPYCQREWFHLDCIEEKNLPDRWYCLECQKQKDKTRNNISRGFFVNRDNDAK